MIPAVVLLALGLAGGAFVILYAAHVLRRVRVLRRESARLSDRADELYKLVGLQEDERDG